RATSRLIESNATRTAGDRARATRSREDVRRGAPGRTFAARDDQDVRFRRNLGGVTVHTVCRRIDELGYMELDRRGAELLFQVLTKREEKASVAIASNESFSGWTKTFTDPRLCAAIV